MISGRGALNPIGAGTTSGLFPSSSLADQVAANTEALRRKRQYLDRVNQTLPNSGTGAWTADTEGNLAAGYGAALDRNG